MAELVSPSARGRPAGGGALRRARSVALLPWALLGFGLAVTAALWGGSLLNRSESLDARNARAEEQVVTTTGDALSEITELTTAAAAELGPAGLTDNDALLSFSAENELVAYDTGTLGLATIRPGPVPATAELSFTDPSGVVRIQLTLADDELAGVLPSLAAARDAGKPTVSPAYELPIGTPAPGIAPPTAFSVVAPVYTGVAPTTVEDRQGALAGWTVAIVNADHFVDAVIARSGSLAELTIRDARSGMVIGSQTSASARDAALGPERVRTLSGGGHSWTLTSRVYEAQELGPVAGARQWLLGLGLLASVVLFGIALVVRRGESRAYRAAEKAQTELAANEERFRAIVQDSTDITLIVTPDGTLSYASPSLHALFGYDPQALVGEDVFDYIHPDDVAAAIAGLTDLLSDEPEDREPTPLRIRCADSSWAEVETVGTDMRDNPAVGGVVVNVRDVTERNRTAALLIDAQERFQRAFEDAPIGMGLADLDGHFIRANQALGDILGQTAEELVGVSIRDITHPDDLEATGREQRRLLAGETSAYHLEKRYLRRDGRVVWAALHVSLVRGADGQALCQIGHVEDISERKAIGERLAHAAIHDALTGLPNRTLFEDRLALALDRAHRKGSHVAVLFVDLDGLKFVNDSFGHAAGDRALIAVADRLRSALRPSDTVARFGGDEFTVLCEDAGDEATALEVAERMGAAVQRELRLSDDNQDVEPLYLTVCTGIALSGGASDTVENLLRDADTALYRAKDRGRDHIVVYDERAHDRVVATLQIGNELHRALERGELVVHYQPVVALDTGRVRGYEALLRWNHPRRGLVHPEEFVPVAEETGLIVPIGRWVLEAACRQVVAWQHADPTERLSMAVNLSPRQLADTKLPEDVATILERTGVDPDDVWLEITETTLMHDAESADSALRALRAQGVHLSVDDFGTGFSSLTYLKRFPVEALKVDRTFVDGLGRESEDTTIVTAVVHLAHALGLVAIAEGLETPTQLAELRVLGCDLAQGFLFSPARPAAEVRPHAIPQLLRG